MTTSEQGELARFVTLVQNECEQLARPVYGLELFARNGVWITAHLATFVDKMECWEINPVYLSDIEKNVPGSTVRCVDSLVYSKQCDDRFDFISIDCPQGVFHGYCEHFEAIERAASLAKDQCVFTFPVNIHPYLAKSKSPNDSYGMISHEEWFDRRSKFYGRPAHQLDKTFVDTFYPRKFQELGLTTITYSSVLFPSTVPGHPDYFVRCIARVRRTRQSQGM